MTRAIRVHEFGGPEVMRSEEVTLAAPGEGEALIRHTAIGLNMSDTYRRRGIHKPPLPFVPGSEGSGIVEAVGPGVTNVAPGDRVGYGGVLGAYADQRLIPAWTLVKVPDGIDDRTVAAMMLKGLTVHYLIYWCHAVQPGDTILIHAAAGGVGLILCQWARHLGATVIGTVGSAAKADEARAHGCHHAILYREEDFAARVAEITDGKGCAAVYDSIGQDTVKQSIRCAGRRGKLICFGQASGPIPRLGSDELRDGSKSFSVVALADHTTSAEEIGTGAKRLFEVVESGAVKIPVNQTFALADVADAHIALESRQTTGSTVLIP